MAGIDAFGTAWQVHDGVSTYNEIGEVVSIDVLDVTAEDIDVTSHDSPGQWMEFLGGLKDGGTLSMEINFDPALHGDLFDLVGTTRLHRIVLPVDADDAEVAFSGHINAFTLGAPHDDKLSGTVSIKVSGAVTLTES